MKPLTLFVNKADIRSEEQGRLVWGAAQAGVAGGVADAVAGAVIPEAEVDALLIVAAVWVDWAAATPTRCTPTTVKPPGRPSRPAPRAGPAIADVLAARDQPENAYFRGGRLPG